MNNSNVTNLAQYKAKKDANNFIRDFTPQQKDDRLLGRILYTLENFGTGINRESPFK